MNDNNKHRKCVWLISYLSKQALSKDNKLYQDTFSRFLIYDKIKIRYIMNSCNIFMQEKVICPICKHLGFKSLVYEIDWKSHFQKFGGYYDEKGNYKESDIIPPVSKAFWCTYGHSWIQT